MQYAAKVSAERGLLAASCYLIPKPHNGDTKSATQKDKERTDMVSLQLILATVYMTVFLHRERHAYCRAAEQEEKKQTKGRQMAEERAM